MSNIPEILFAKFKVVLDMADDGVPSRREFSGVIADFSSLYKRASVADQGEYHRRVAEMMRAAVKDAFGSRAAVAEMEVECAPSTGS